eukprot:gene23563-9087_t
MGVISLNDLVSMSGWQPVFAGLLLLGALLPAKVSLLAAVALATLPIMRTLCKAFKLQVPAAVKHHDDVELFLAPHRAKLEGGFVVFLIGDWKWMGDTMGAMQAELKQAELKQADPEADPEVTGSPKYIHTTFWAQLLELQKRNPAIGAWHETYSVPAWGGYETVYTNMPRTLLGAAVGAEYIPITKDMATAKARMAEATSACPFMPSK